MPFGPPLCGDDLHHHAHVHKPPTVPIVPDLARKVAMANDYVEREFQAMTAIRYKMKDMVAKAEADWDSLSKPLEKACNDTHEALVKLAETSHLCDNAQHSALATLFEKRSKLPEGEKQNMRGCAKFKNVLYPEESDDCKCAAASEHDGCRDAQITSDHTLICTQLRHRVLPHMALWRLTKPGGSCYIDSRDVLNRPMLTPGAPVDFEFPENAANAASIPFSLLALPPLCRPAVAVRPSCRRDAASKRAHNFL